MPGENYFFRVQTLTSILVMETVLINTTKYLYWVLFKIEWSFGLISINENGVVIPIVTEFVLNFYGVGSAYKSSVEKLRPILDLINWKITEYMGYYALQSYSWLFLSGK